MLGTRLLVTLLVVPPLAAIVYVGGIPVIVLAVVAALLAAHELIALLRAAQLSVFGRPLAISTVLLVAVGAWPQLQLARFAVPLVLLIVSAYALLTCRLDGRDGATALREAALGWVSTLAGAVYLGVPFGAALALRTTSEDTVMFGSIPLPLGAAWLALALTITWMGDSAAYFVGRYLGKRRFSPLISPKKTLEGAVGGLTATTIVGALGGPVVGLALLPAALLGLVAGAAGIAGDLMESLLKRVAGIKDSGSVFPGHGGMLDRVDAMLFVVLVVYLVQQLPRAPLA